MNRSLHLFTLLIFGLLTFVSAGNPLAYEPPFLPDEHTESVPRMDKYDDAVKEGYLLPKAYRFVCGDNLLEPGRSNPMGLNLVIGRDFRPVTRFSYWGSNDFGYGHPFNQEPVRAIFDDRGNI